MPSTWIANDWSNMKAEQKGKSQRKIRNLLLNKRFQIRYTMIIVGVTVLISLGLGWKLYGFMVENRKLSGLESVGLSNAEQDPEFDAEMQREIARKDKNFLLWLALGLGTLVIALGLLGIVITHKVAGPVFVVSRFTRHISNGRWNAIRPFRKGDEFQFLYDDFQHMVTALKKIPEDDIAILQEVLERLRSVTDQTSLEEARVRISALIEMKSKYLEGRMSDMGSPSEIRAAQKES